MPCCNWIAFNRRRWGEDLNQQRRGLNRSTLQSAYIGMFIRSIRTKRPAGQVQYQVLCLAFKCHCSMHKRHGGHIQLSTIDKQSAVLLLTGPYCFYSYCWYLLIISSILVSLSINSILQFQSHNARHNISVPDGSEMHSNWSQFADNSNSKRSNSCHTRIGWHSVVKFTSSVVTIRIPFGVQL